MSTTTPEPTRDTSATVDPTAVSNLPSDLQDERLIAQSGVSGAVRVFFSRLRSGDLGALPSEHREVTVLFTDIVGFTARTEQQDAAADE